MKKILFICLAVTGLGLLIAGISIPAFAHDSNNASTQEGAWQAMHEACEDGDWEAMEELHEEGFYHMHHHDEDDHTHEDGDETPSGYWDGMGGNMGGGMMGW